MNHTAPKDPKDANSMFGAKLLLGEIRRKFYGNLLVSTERDQTAELQLKNPSTLLLIAVSFHLLS